MNLLSQFFEIEQLLNKYSGKRYHIRSIDDWRFQLVEVKAYGKEKIIIEDATAEQMKGFLERSLRVTLVIEKQKQGSVNMVTRN